MELNIYHPHEYPINTSLILKFEGIKFNWQSHKVNETNSDLIPFEKVDILFKHEEKDITKTVVESFKNHPNYTFSVENPNIPILIFHQHEFLLEENFNLLINVISRELKREKDKIIIVDCSLYERQGLVNLPIVAKLNQFKLNIFQENNEKIKKFVFLNNKNSPLRFQVFDKIIKNYDNNIELLKNENTLSFRNFDEDLMTYSNILNEDLFQKYINESSYYKFNNGLEFYKNIDLPWILDNFELGEVIDNMFYQTQKFYSHGFYSIIVETDNYYLSLDNKEEIKEMAFSEKLFISFSSGNLPFIVHDGKYYEELEKQGLDFSYLKSIFGINYKQNNIKQNFDSLDVFINHLKNKSIDEIREEYNSVIPILENNKKIIYNSQKRIMTNEVQNFLLELKQLKHK